MDLKLFGERLQALRKQTGMSQDRLAQALDELAQIGPRDDYRVVDATLISRWENARSQSGRQWKPTRPYLLYLIRLFRNHLTAEAAQAWANDAGYQIPSVDLQDLFGLVAHVAGLDTETQPLQHNLPSPMTSFVNHENEVAMLVESLLPANQSMRLMTILGEGGVGKTRLVLAAAHIVAQRETLADGVWFVPLAGIDAAPTREVSSVRPNPVILALAQSLSFKFSPREDLAAQVARFLHNKSLLLIFDNCEHLVEEVASIVELLHHTPRVRLWATSRTSLNCQAEHVLPLAGLATPMATTSAQADDASLVNVPSIRLFIERAQQRGRVSQQVDSQALHDMARLCNLVGGSPLALELAANWVGHLSVNEMVEMLQRRDLSLLTTNQQDVPLGHRSMNAVFETSWQLLSSANQIVFAQLSVFRGAFSREAALAVANASITNLVAFINQSLLGAIQPKSFGPSQYIVHDLLREFTAAKLSTVEAHLLSHERVAYRHAVFYLRLLSERQDAFYGDGSYLAVAEIDAVIDNVRAAWQWAVSQSELELIAQTWLALRHFYHVRGLYQEGEASFREAVANIQRQHPADPVLADLRIAQAFFLNQMQRNVQSIEVIQSALTALSESAISSAFSPVLIRANMEWGIALSLQGKHDAAIAMLTEAVAQAQEMQMDAVAARGLHAMYRNHQARGDFARANAVLEQASVLYHRVGYTLAEGFVRDALGHVALWQGALSRALQHYQDSLRTYERVMDQTRAIHVRKYLGSVAMYMGDFGTAYAYLQKAYLHQADDPDQRNVASTLNHFSQLLCRLGDYAHAQDYAQRALSIGRQINSQSTIADALFALGRILLQRGNAPAALANYQDALSVIERSGAHSYIGMAWLGIGEALIELGRLDAAQVALDKTVNLQGNLPQTQLALSTTCALAQLAYGHNQLAQAMELVYDILAVASLHDYEYGADLPPILWKCYQIAHVVGDKCATSILQMAYRLVQAQATSVEDTALHQSFLTQVKLNREIVTAFDEPT